MLPLTTDDLLTHAIVGSVLDDLDMERLVREVGHAVAQRILGNNEIVDDVAKELHEKLLLRNESTKKVVIESIYKESEEAKHNVSVFMAAASLAEARPLLRRVSYTLVIARRNANSHRRSTGHDLQINIYRRGRHMVVARMGHTAHIRRHSLHGLHLNLPQRLPKHLHPRVPLGR